MSETVPEFTPRSITIREFGESPSGWIEVAHYTEQPLLITRRGRFVALVEPIVDEGKLISRAISSMVESRELDLNIGGPSYTTDEIRAMLDEQHAPSTEQE